MAVCLTAGCGPCLQAVRLGKFQLRAGWRWPWRCAGEVAFARLRATMGRHVCSALARTRVAHAGTDACMAPMVPTTVGGRRFLGDQIHSAVGPFLAVRLEGLGYESSGVVSASLSCTVLTVPAEGGRRGGGGAADYVQLELSHHRGWFTAPGGGQSRIESPRAVRPTFRLRAWVASGCLAVGHVRRLCASTAPAKGW